MGSNSYRQFDSTVAKRKAKERALLLELMHLHESVQEDDKAAGYRNEVGEIERELSDNLYSFEGRALGTKKAKKK